MKRGRARLKLDVQGQGGGRILDVDGQGGGGFENWTIFMDVICVSSLFWKANSKNFTDTLSIWFLTQVY